MRLNDKAANVRVRRKKFMVEAVTRWVVQVLELLLLLQSRSLISYPLPFRAP